MRKFLPMMLVLVILASLNPIVAQQVVRLSIETPCQVTSTPEHPALPDIDLFDIYPNPNQGDFAVKFDHVLLNEQLEISIYDSYGNLILLQTLKVTETQYPFHLQDIAGGLYVVSIQSGPLSSRKKLIIF